MLTQISLSFAAVSNTWTSSSDWGLVVMLVFGCSQAVDGICKYLKIFQSFANSRWDTDNSIRLKILEIQGELQECEGGLQFEKRTNKGMRVMYLNRGQPIFCNGWRCLMSKAWASSWKYICSCLCTQEVVPVQISSRQAAKSKSNAPVKMIMQIKAAYLQSLFSLYSLQQEGTLLRNQRVLSQFKTNNPNIEGIRL